MNKTVAISMTGGACMRWRAILMQELICYKQLPVWTEKSIPQGFKNQHNTKAGTWAKLRLLKGELRFAMLEASGVVQSEHVFTPEQHRHLLNLRLGTRLFLPARMSNASCVF